MHDTPSAPRGRHPRPARIDRDRRSFSLLPLFGLPLLGLGVLGAGAFALPAAADPTLRDLQVAVRALAFLEQPPTGQAEIGIVYPEQSPAGRAEAQRVAASFGDGLRAGNLTLRPRLVTVAGAGQAGTAALLLTDAALPQAGEVAAAIGRRGVVTITTNPEAVQGGTVVLAVRSNPRVEILVNRAAAEAAGVSFAAAFRMMIQER